MGAKKQTKDVESHIGNANNHIASVEHVEGELEPEKERENELEIIFQDEPIWRKKKETTCARKIREKTSQTWTNH